MSEEQYAPDPITHTRMAGATIDRQTRFDGHRSRLLQILIGIGIAILLICIEGIVWLLNPAHIFGEAAHSFSTLLAIPAHTPLLLLIPLLELIILSVLVLLSERPLAIRAYIRETQKGLERYRASYTPLTSWSTMYNTAISYSQDTPDPTIFSPPQSMSTRDLARVRYSPLLILGAQGMGKTTILHMYQSISLQRRTALMFGRDSIPIYVPLNQYSHFLKALSEVSPEEALENGTLLNFLFTFDLPALHHLRPFLSKLIAKGRVWFLCDGLDEVDEQSQTLVNRAVAQLMGQQQNRLILTSSEAHFRCQQELVQAANENLAAQATLLPLDSAQIRAFIEQYIDSGASLSIARPGNERQHTAGQIMDVIMHSPARDQYANPMLLFLLLEIIDEVGAERTRRLNTRARLLQQFVLCLIRHASKKPPQQHQSSPVGARLIAPPEPDKPTENEVLTFLGEVAWAARNAHDIHTIQLPITPQHTPVGASAERSGARFNPSRPSPIDRPAAPSHESNQERIEEIAASLQTWLNAETQLIAPNSTSETSHQPYSHIELLHLLQSARHANLLDISSGGILSFRHPMIAAYLAGHYLNTEIGASIATSEQGWIGSEAHIQHMLGEIENWAEPIAMWAGLADNPLALAEQFTAQARMHAAPEIETLIFSLLCIGTARSGSRESGQEMLPPEVEKAAAGVLSDAESRQKLARIFTHCAGNGAEEIYASLLPMLMIDNTEQFIPLLDPVRVPALLFKYLCEIVDDAAYDRQVKRLVRVLGQCGAAAMPRAAELSELATGRSLRLRSAAINVLGGTNDPGAVAPLLARLGDKDQFVMNRAISALVRLGPEHTLPSLLQALDNRTPSPVQKQMHEAVLHILERFLDETNPARRLNSLQHQRILNFLLAMPNANYAPEVQQAAREMVVRQGRTAEKSESGEKAVDLLVQNLASNDEATARNALKTLKEIGQAATPRLLGLLRQQPPEPVRVRIVEVFGHVRDSRALPYLLTLLADSSRDVQQQVALALHAYAPASIPGLIDVVLHGDNDIVAGRAEQILGDTGVDALNPVIEALFPIEPERTHLLVHVLEYLHDARAIPALITLLQTAQAGQTLLLAVIHTLGGFADARAVPPLLAMLEHSNPLLYEGAINALSRLGEVALDPLIAALDGHEKTQVTTRVQRALLGMVDFPGEQLLNALAQASDAQTENIIDVFLEKGAEAAQILVAHLFHPNRRVQECVRLMVGEMSGQIIVPPLLDELNRPEASWRAVIGEYLLRHPQEAVPPLVALLDDPERSDAAFTVLLDFDQEILPRLVPGLDSLNNMAQERSQRIIVELVKHTPEAVDAVVQLFSLSLPQRAHETLVHVLVHDLAEVSLPTLLRGLEDAHLVGNVSEVMVRMVQEDGKNGEMALNALLNCLRIEPRRHGAAFTLVEIGEKAVPGVGKLITDPDPQVAHAAQNILSEMGVPAFTFIWSARSDTSNLERREAARTIFRNMRTVVIKDELVELLKSTELDKISMALVLLLERIHDEALQPGSEHEMIPALLEHVQTHSDEQASLRVLALLLLLGSTMVLDHMTQALYDYPNHQQRIIQAFLLLGEEAEEALLDMLHDPDAPSNLHAEAAGVLGMIAPHPDIRENVRLLGEYGLWAGRSIGRNGLLQADRLAISLRALGGLLAGGHWDSDELQNLRNHSREGSAERELYTILLGGRYGPRITALEHDLESERQQHKQERASFMQKVMEMNAQIEELEHDLEQTRHEHNVRSEELDHATREIDHLHANLNQALQERQALRSSLQQAIKEKEALQAENHQWRAYGERLEDEINQLKE